MKNQTGGRKLKTTAVIIAVLVIAGIIIGFFASGTGLVTGTEPGSGSVVEDNSIVLLDYTLGVVDSNGVRVIQTTDRQTAIDSNTYSPFNSYSPINVTVGSPDILAEFSGQITGMKPGEEKTFAIPPENAYGQYNPDLIRTFPVSMINAMQLRIGSRITSDIGVGTVVALNATHATIDFNHVLAGYTLVYKVRILKVE